MTNETFCIQNPNWDEQAQSGLEKSVNEVLKNTHRDTEISELKEQIASLKKALEIREFDMRTYKNLYEEALRELESHE